MYLIRHARLTCRFYCTTSTPHQNHPRQQVFDEFREDGETAISLPAKKSTSRSGALLTLCRDTWGGDAATRQNDWMNHEGSASNVCYRPPVLPNLPEVAFIARKDVGKTRLLTQMLTPYGRFLLRKARAPGNDNVINFFRIGNFFRIVDTPGYGYTGERRQVQYQWQNLVRSLIQNRPNLKHVYLLTEAKPEGFTERDAMMMEFLALHGISFTQVVTRADGVLTTPYNEELKTLPMEERQLRLLKQIEALKAETGCEHIPTILCSHKDGKGVGALLYDIIGRVADGVPTEDLTLKNMTQNPFYCEDTQRYRAANTKVTDDSRTTNPEIGVDDDVDLIHDCKFLPPAHVDHGFFMSHAMVTGFRPKGERVALKMKSEEEEALENPHHPLAGSPELAKYVCIKAFALFFEPRNEGTHAPCHIGADSRRLLIISNLFHFVYLGAPLVHPVSRVFFFQVKLMSLLLTTHPSHRYFPTLAEEYLHSNHAESNPTVKPAAERYFGMPLPVNLRMKYATPEEKENWRKVLNKPH